MKDLHGDLDNVLMEAIALRRNSTQFRWLFLHAQRYLLGHLPLGGEDDIADFDSNR